MNKNAASLQPHWGGHNPIPRPQSTRSDVPGREILVELLNGRAVGILRWSLRWAGDAFFGVPALIPTASGGLSGILGQYGGVSFKAKPLLASPVDAGTLLKCRGTEAVKQLLCFQKKGCARQAKSWYKALSDCNRRPNNICSNIISTIRAIKHQAPISANKLSAQVAQFSSLNKASHHLPAMSNDAE